MLEGGCFHSLVVMSCLSQVWWLFSIVWWLMSQFGGQLHMAQARLSSRCVAPAALPLFVRASISIVHGKLVEIEQV